jgi:hypothetical protein
MTETNNKARWAICSEWRNTGTVSIGPYYFVTQEKANDVLANYHYKALNGDKCIKSTWLQKEGSDQRYYYVKNIKPELNMMVAMHEFDPFEHLFLDGILADYIYLQAIPASISDCKY